MGVGRVRKSKAPAWMAAARVVVCVVLFAVGSATGYSLAAPNSSDLTRELERKEQSALEARDMAALVAYKDKLIDPELGPAGRIAAGAAYGLLFASIGPGMMPMILMIPRVFADDFADEDFEWGARTATVLACCVGAPSLVYGHVLTETLWGESASTAALLAPLPVILVAGALGVAWLRAKAHAEDPW